MEGGTLTEVGLVELSIGTRRGIDVDITSVEQGKKETDSENVTSTESTSVTVDSNNSIISEL